MRIVYHAAPRDHQTELNEQHVADWDEDKKTPRVTSRICHDKFMVLSRVNNERRTPAAVLCGSTNFTHNGVYRQANVVHTANRPELAADYLELFEVLFSGKTPGETKKWINVNNPLSSDAGIVAGFSPRGGEVDLDLFAAEIRGAARDVLFCTAFDLNERILEALKGKPQRRDPALRAAELADDRSPASTATAPPTSSRPRCSTRASRASSRSRRRARGATS